jgi:transcriptional regulator with XRE-family HTH domain
MAATRTRSGGKMAGVGEEIRRKREELRLSQPQAAVKAGVAVSALSQIENGKRSPNLSTLEKIAGALGCEVVDLFPKAQAPLPLEDHEAARRRGVEEAERMLVEAGPFYDRFEASGRLLATGWNSTLAEWEEKLPPGEVPSAFDAGRLIEWGMRAHYDARSFEYLAEGDDPRARRAELKDTLLFVKEAERAVEAFVMRVFGDAKVRSDFRKQLSDPESLETLLERYGEASSSQESR